MRYIDIIRTLIRNASEKDIPALDWDEQQKHLGMIKARIDDVEIVVRCKDCKYWHNNTEFCDIWSHANFIAQRTLADDYCSLAERREESEVEK